MQTTVQDIKVYIKIRIWEREEKENEEQRRHERFVAVLQNYVNMSSGLGPVEKPVSIRLSGIIFAICREIL